MCTSALTNALEDREESVHDLLGKHGRLESHSLLTQLADEDGQ